jgi:hypothetical protein
VIAEANRPARAGSAPIPALGTAGIALLGLLLAAPLPGRATEILSDPDGVQVAVEGDVSLRGVTPLAVDELPPGSYRLTVGGYHMPRTQGRLVRALDGTLETDRLNGAGVMLLPPGAAHLRQKGERWRGGWLLLGGGATLTGTIVNFGRVSQAEDDLALAQRLYDRAVSEDDIRAARNAVLLSQQEVDDAKEMRTLWGVASLYLWVGAGLEAWALTPTPELATTADGNYRLANPPATRGGAVLRSVLLPGGGQRYLGQGNRANWFLVGVTGFTVGALVAHDEFLERRREQEEAQLRFAQATTPEEVDRWRNELESRHGSTQDMQIVQWTLAGLAAGVYVWNVLDAATLVRSSGAPNTFSLSVAPTPSGATAALHWRLD